VTEPNTSRRIVRTFVQTIHATPDRVFPLLCPEREKEWLPGWDARMLYSASGVAERGAVFQTRNDAGRTLWIVTEYDPPRRVAFARWQPDGIIVHIEISLGLHHDKSSAVCISYTYTAVDEAGTTSLAGTSLVAMTEESWLRTMSFWQESMNEWLEKQLRRPPA
jgi:hypothetical protein